MGIGNWGILSDEWWVTKIEWRVISDKKEKKKKQRATPKLSKLLFFVRCVGIAYNDKWWSSVSYT